MNHALSAAVPLQWHCLDFRDRQSNQLPNMRIADHFAVVDIVDTLVTTSSFFAVTRRFTSRFMGTQARILLLRRQLAAKRINESGG
jgi:hypothetical protein